MKTQCPHCNAGFDVPDTYSGKRAKCPKCQQGFVVAEYHSPTENATVPLMPKTTNDAISKKKNHILSKLKKTAIFIGLFLFILLIAFYAGKSSGGKSSVEKINQLQQQVELLNARLETANSMKNKLRAALDKKKETIDSGPAKSNVRPVEINSEVQAERLALIETLIQRGVFAKVECPGTIPKIWIGPAFNGLDFDTKESFCSVVAAYYYEGTADKNKTVRVIDNMSGNEIGQFSAVYAGLKLKD